VIRTSRICACLVLAVTAGQLVSCAALSSTTKSMHALDAGTPAPSPDRVPARPAATAPAGIPRDRILQVRRVNIAPPFDGLSLVYRAGDGTYVKDYYNEWVAPPEELFTTQLIGYLSASGAFPSVVDDRSTAPHGYALEMSITSLYGDFRDPNHPAAVLSARVYLLDGTGGNRRVAYQDSREISVPVAAASAQQFVVGSGRALGQLLEGVARDLSVFGKTAVVGGGR
jgi:uncharacterized lipoprotein YmbA